jgi:O-antigen ligase
VIQAGFAAGAVWCVCRYPASAIAIYLLGFYLPTQILESRAPLPYPYMVLPIALAAGILVPSHQRVGIPRLGGAAWILLLALCMLTCASCLWGNEWISPNLFLGFAFVLSSFAMLRGERDWWIGCGGLAAAELVLGLWTYYTVRNLAVDGAAGHFASSEATGDVNYSSFHVGLAVLTGWCVALSGCRLLKSARGLSFAIRGMAVLVFVVGLLLIVQFQSRGISAAVVLGLAASLIQSRSKFRTVAVTGVLLGIFLTAISQTATFDLFLERWRDKDEMASGTGRLDLWKSSWQQYEEGPVITKIIGFGYGTELKRTKFDGLVRGSQISTHNSFIRFLLDQGLAGVVLFVLALAFCSYHAWRRQDEVGNLRFGIVVFLAVACLSLEPHMSTEFWLALGLCLPLSLSSVSVPVPAVSLSAGPQARRPVAAWRPFAGLNAARRRWSAKRHASQLMQRPPYPRITSVGFARQRIRRRFFAPKLPR